MVYSQKYFKSDADGILKSFKAGDPSAFVLYKQLTKTASFHYDKKGEKVLDTRKDRKGKTVKVFRWKLTARKPKKRQSPAIHDVKGFIAPLAVGFNEFEAKEIPKGGFIKVKVDEARRGGKGYKTAIKPTIIGPFIGDSIRETIEHIIPSMGLKEQIKKKVKSLIVSGFVMVYKPENPYKAGTADFKAREEWSEAVWKGGSVRRFNVGANIHRLVNFATVLASSIRTSMSHEGVRVSSALHLRNSEAIQKKRDITIFQPLGFPPVWPLIINEPPSGVTDVNGNFLPATEYLPLRYEGDQEWPIHKNKSKFATKIILHLGIRAAK
jgi:hypothetical protein